MKLFESKMSVGQDSRFVDDIEKLVNNNLGRFGFSDSTKYSDIAAALRDKITPNAGGRTITDTELAYRIAGKFLNDSSLPEDLVLETRTSLANLFNRQQFFGFGVDDGLGIYINKLGFAASLDKQRYQALQELESLARNSEYSELVRPMLDKLKTTGVLIYSPEAAIDPALAGGSSTLKAGATPEELINSIRAYISRFWVS
jgi:hypothetical protein